MTKKEVKQNRRKKRLFLAILMILFTGSLLATSTFAWFTANKTVTVDAIDVNVAAANGLQISVDGINWKPAVSNKDILDAYKTYASSVNQIPASSSSPVSTVGAIDSNTGYMNMYAGAIETTNDGSAYILTAEKSTEANNVNEGGAVTSGGTSGNFVAFDLFFMTTSATPIYLTNSSSVLYKDNGGPKGIQNAARVALVTQGTVPAGSSATDIQAIKAKAGTKPFIWEPNFDVHTASAVANASSVYGVITTETKGTQVAYRGVKAAIPKTANVALNSADTNYFGDVTVDLATPSSGIDDTFDKVFDLNAGITKVRIYMWIEGQDVDCENDASGGSISFNLQFSMNEK